MNNNSQTAQAESVEEMAVSNFDRISAGLTSSIVTCGCLMLMLLIMLIRDTPAQSNVSQPPLPQRPLVSVSHLDPQSRALEDEIDDFQSAQVTVSIDLISDAVSSVMASNNDIDSHEDVSIHSLTRPDPRFPNPDGIPDATVSEAQRWLVSYETTDIQQYARQLDFFGIELGVVRLNSNEIVRVGGLSGSVLASESDRLQESETLRFSHKKRGMRRWDESLCRRTGVDLSDSSICQFYPESTRKIIRQVEAEALAEKGRKLSDVRQTILKVQPSGDGFQFIVLDFNYRL